MKQLILFSAIAVLTVFSCRKKDKDPEPAPSTTGGTTTGGTSSYPGTTNYDALFEMNNVTPKSGGNFSPMTMNTRAMLSTQTVTNELISTFVNMGVVQMNAVTLKDQWGSSNYYYFDTTGTTHTAPYTWSVSGSSSFAAASFTNDTPFPAYSGFNSIPDSASKSAGFTLNLSGLSNCDFVECRVYGSGGSSVIDPKYVTGSATSLSFSANDLSGLNTGNGYLSVKIANDNVQTINGKLVNIRSAISYEVTDFKIKP